MRGAKQVGPREDVMLQVRILGTASVLPERAVTTAELAREVGREPEVLERKTGIRTRHWAAPGARMSWCCSPAS